MALASVGAVGGGGGLGGGLDFVVGVGGSNNGWNIVPTERVLCEQLLQFVFRVRLFVCIGRRPSTEKAGGCVCRCLAAAGSSATPHAVAGRHTVTPEGKQAIGRRRTRHRRRHRRRHSAAPTTQSGPARLIPQNAGPHSTRGNSMLDVAGIRLAREYPIYGLKASETTHELRCRQGVAVKRRETLKMFPASPRALPSRSPLDQKPHFARA